MRADTQTPQTPSLGEPPAPNMAWIPGGTFLMGSDDHYPEEAPAHEVTVDGFWIDRFTVTNAEFAPLRPQDRPRDRRRASARPGRVPGREAGAAGSVVDRLPGAGPPGRPLEPLQLVDVRAGRELAPPAGAGHVGREEAGSPGRPRRLGRRQRLRDVDREGAADRGRVGAGLPRRRSTERPSPGARSSTRRAASWPTRGRASSRSRTSSRTATSARRRSAASPPTASASTT